MVKNKNFDVLLNFRTDLGTELSYLEWDEVTRNRSRLFSIVSE